MLRGGPAQEPLVERRGRVLARSRAAGGASGEGVSPDLLVLSVFRRRGSSQLLSALCGTWSEAQDVAHGRMVEVVGVFSGGVASTGVSQHS